MSDVTVIGLGAMGAALARTLLNTYQVTVWNRTAAKAEPLVEAGAVRKVRIVADKASFYVEIQTSNGASTAETMKGKLKTWATLNAAAKWVRSMGIGKAELMLTHWTPDQRQMPL